MSDGEQSHKKEEFTRIALNFSREGEVVIAQVTGELDFGTVRHFAEKLETLQKAGLVQFVIDIRQVTYIDSSGIASLIQQHRSVAGLEGRLVVLWPQDRPIKMAIERTRIATKMNFRETLEEALGFLASPEEVAEEPTPDSPEQGSPPSR